MTDNVIEFARPPVRQSIVVQAGRVHTFAVFTDQLAAWWPLDPFSYGGSQRIACVTLEPRVGGRVSEHWYDGMRHEWGTLLTWDPPAGFVMTWNNTGHPTEVELRFTETDNDATLVEVEHRGWDKLTPDELTAACALPGGYAGDAFARGWSQILTNFKEHIEQ